MSCSVLTIKKTVSSYPSFANTQDFSLAYCTEDHIRSHCIALALCIVLERSFLCLTDP